MKKSKLMQPEFLKLDEKSQEDLILNIKSNNLNDKNKQIIEEHILFTKDLKNHLQNSSISLQQIKELFEIFSKKMQVVQ